MSCDILLKVGGLERGVGLLEGSGGIVDVYQ